MQHKSSVLITFAVISAAIILIITERWYLTVSSQPAFAYREKPIFQIFY